MLTILRNLFILAARQMFTGRRFGTAVAAAFGAQFALSGFVLSFGLFVTSILAGLVAAYLIAFIQVTWKTAKSVKASRLHLTRAW